MRPVAIPEALADDPRLHHEPMEGRFAVCRLPVVDLHDSDEEGRAGPSVGTQLVRGERALVVGEGEGKDAGWLRLACEHDRYLGWARRVAFDLGDGPRPPAEPTHTVAVPRTFLYPSPDLARRPPVGTLSIGSRVAVRRSLTVRSTPYAILEDSRSVIERHLAQKGTVGRDPVGIAELLLHTPYQWGGRSALGIDCSGLVQLTHALCGRAVLRDADMQERSIGQPLDCSFDPDTGAPRRKLERGDLLFWKGHVAMARDASTLIHANGYAMAVSIETVEEAVRRIAPLYGTPRSVRRP